MTGSRTQPFDWALAVAAAMLFSLPLVAIQGPLHTTPMDAVNFLVIGGYWTFVLMRRETLEFPLALPFWLIMIGSCGGLYATIDYPRAFTVLAEDVYLYAWFVTLTHFLSRRVKVDRVVVIWVVVACGVALATVLDQRTNLFGGRFSAAGAIRAAGTFENPNMFGDYLVLSFYLAWAGAAGGRRAFYLALPALMAGVLATASNGAMASVIGGGLATAVMQPAWRTPRRIGALLMAGGVLLGALSVAVNSGIDLGSELANRKRGEVGGAAGKGMEERVPVWLDAWYDLQEMPTGVGPGNFNRDGGPVSHDDHAAHNEYVGMLVERGPLGLIGFIGILAGIVTALERLRRRGLACGLGVSQLYGALGAIAAHALVIELSHFRHMWLGLAILWAVAAQTTAQRRSTDEPAWPAMQEAA